MSKYLALMIVSIIFLGTLTIGNAQTHTGPLLVLEYETALSVQPSSISSIVLSRYEHIDHIVRVDDGSVYILTRDSHNYSLIMYRSGELSTRIMNFSLMHDIYPSGPESPNLGSFSFVAMDDSIYMGDLYVRPTSSILILTEMDFLGNIVSENNITIVGNFYVPRLFRVGEDDALYLIVGGLFSEGTHLLKMNINGSLIWNKELSIDEYIDLDVMSNGQVIFLSASGIESWDSDGEFMWSKRLNPGPYWYPFWEPLPIRILDDNSICVIADVTEVSIRGPYGPTNLTLHRFYPNGTILWNTTIIARNSTGTQIDFHANLFEVSRESIHILVDVIGVENNPYLLRMSENLTQFDKWALDIQTLEERQLQFDRDGFPIIFGVDIISDERRLVAYSFSTTLSGTVLILGGAFSGFCVIVLLLYDRRKANLKK